MSAQRQRLPAGAHSTSGAGRVERLVRNDRLGILRPAAHFQPQAADSEFATSAGPAGLIEAGLTVRHGPPPGTSPHQSPSSVRGPSASRTSALTRRRPVITRAGRVERRVRNRRLESRRPAAHFHPQAADSQFATSAGPAARIEAGLSVRHGPPPGTNPRRCPPSVRGLSASRTERR